MSGYNQSMKLTLLELVFPKRAIKRLQIKDDLEYALFKSDMSDFERKITKSDIALTQMKPSS